VTLVTTSIILGNSRLHVGIGSNSDIRDVYYPYVGYSDHVHRISLGVFADGKMSWLRDGWAITQEYFSDSPIGRTDASSDERHLKINLTDFVHYTWDALWRKITVQNDSNQTRDVRLFSYQDLHIDENPLGDTAMLDPHLQAIIHYKNDFYFAFCSIPAFSQFATGRKEWQGLEGTWRDADDGMLSGNAVSNGSVDSCLGWDFNSLGPGESKSIQLFMAVGRHFRDIRRVHVHSRRDGFDQAMRETEKYWRNWLEQGQDIGISGFDQTRVQEVYNRSLLVLRSMCSENGALIASSDSEIERIGGDTYDYVWPRDASWCVMALDQCGYHEVARRFFKFIFNVMTEKGYFLHKYYPTGLFGSTWHPVPFIQIDQSGIVLFALWNFCRTSGDIEFIADQWQKAVKVAEFLARWRDKSTGLPNPSWDIWEEREGTYAYSASAVYAGLNSASQLAKLVGSEKHATIFEEAASEVKQGILESMYDEKLGRFLRSVNPRDEALDSSLLAINMFGVLPANDRRLASTVDQIENELWVNTKIGGIARYKGDGYLRVDQNIIGNPWILTALYLSIYHSDAGDPTRAKQLIDWATDRATKTSLLPEQVNAYDGSPVGVLPLAWSHAAYVLAVRHLANLASTRPS